jgi:hypothetical protein
MLKIKMTLTQTYACDDVINYMYGAPAFWPYIAVPVAEDTALCSAIGEVLKA